MGNDPSSIEKGSYHRDSTGTKARQRIYWFLGEGKMMSFKSIRVVLLSLVGLAILVGIGCTRSGAYHSQSGSRGSAAAYRGGGGDETLAGLESIPGSFGRKTERDHRIAYTVGPDDVLTVEVRQHPEIGGQFLVSPEGTVFISLIGSVDVEDATTEEIARRIEERLSEFIRDPEVGVSVAAYNSKKVYVIGQVRAPGEYTMKGNALSVRDAVLLAGLPLDTANLPRVAVITPDEENPQVVLINLNDILYKGIMRSNIELKPGDVVVVHRHLLAKLGAFLDQIIGPTARIRAVENIVTTIN